MSLTKKQRLQVWNKSRGACWYCGNELPEKGWHADHCEAVYRWPDEMLKPQNDTLENMVPACAPCNLFKSVFSIEEFRREIALQVKRARKQSVNFRTAERFGLIEVKPVEVVFWFERSIKCTGDSHDSKN